MYAPFATHTPFYKSIEIPTLVIGAGSINKAYSNDEFVSITDLVKAIEIIK